MGLQSSHSERLSQTHFAMGTSNTLGEKVGLDLIRKHEMHCVTNDWIRNTSNADICGDSPKHVLAEMSSPDLKVNLGGSSSVMFENFCV